MALDITCIPAIREEVVHLREADMLHELEERQLALLARGATGCDVQKTIAHRSAAGRWWPLRRHRPLRAAHTH